MALADDIRRYVLNHHVEQARAAGATSVAVVAGEIHREMGFQHRTAAVCAALDSQLFLRFADVTLLQREGPAQSTTARWVFGIRSRERDSFCVEAFYRDGVLRPVTPLDGLSEDERVRVTVESFQRPREAAGRFARFVGTLTHPEAREMEEALEREFESCGDDW